MERVLHNMHVMFTGHLFEHKKYVAIIPTQDAAKNANNNPPNQALCATLSPIMGDVFPFHPSYPGRSIYPCTDRFCPHNQRGFDRPEKRVGAMCCSVAQVCYLARVGSASL